MSDTGVQDNSGDFLIPRDDVDGVKMTDAELADVMSSMSNDEAIEAVARGLLYERGYRDLDRDTEDEMVRDLVSRINNAVGTAVIEAVPENEQDSLEGLVTDGNTEGLRALVERSGRKLEDVMAEALENFGRKYLEEKTEK